MANVQCPGFIPLRSRVAGANIALARKRVLTNNTTAIAMGDAVAKQATGDYIVVAAAGTTVSSVARGASYISDGQRVERKHLPAATLYTSSGAHPNNASYIYVVDDPVNTVFEASIDEAMALTDLGLNYNMVLGTFTTSGYSGHELDATSRAVTATLPWRVNEFIMRADNDVDAADAHVECQISVGATANNAGTDSPAIAADGT